MPDIFAGTQPPAWLERLTTPSEPGLLGKIFGDLVGSFADSTEVAIDKAQKKQAQGIDTSWIKELPGSLKQGMAEARLNAQNPLWKMQAQQAQLNMAQQAIGIQNQQSLIQSRATTLRMQQHDQEVLPQWLQEHPTWESRQDAEPPVLYTTQGQKMFRDVQLGDAGNIKHKSMVEGVNAFANSVAALQKLDPISAAPFAAQIGKVPTPQMQQQLDAAMATAKTKQQEALKPVPMEIQVGGRTVQGYMQGGKFKEVKPEKAAVSKISPGDKAQLDYARHHVEDLERQMGDPQNKSRLPDLRNQWYEARKYFNRLTKQFSGEPEPAATAAPAPTKATGPSTDPLGLFGQ